jgi:hypothetical protein
VNEKKICRTDGIILAGEYRNILKKEPVTGPLFSL